MSSLQLAVTQIQFFFFLRPGWTVQRSRVGCMPCLSSRKFQRSGLAHHFLDLFLIAFWVGWFVHLALRIFECLALGDRMNLFQLPRSNHDSAASVRRGRRAKPKRNAAHNARWERLQSRHVWGNSPWFSTIPKDGSLLSNNTYKHKQHQ